MSMDHLEAHRKHYSQLVTATGGVDPTNTKLVSAFATVRREDYLGPGPWKIRASSKYCITPTEDTLSYSAKFISSASFIPCVGARDEKTAFELADTFNQGGAREVKSLRRDNSSDDTCWFKWKDCWLSIKSV